MHEYGFCNTGKSAKFKQLNVDEGFLWYKKVGTSSSNFLGSIIFKAYTVRCIHADIIITGDFHACRGIHFRHTLFKHENSLTVKSTSTDQNQPNRKLLNIYYFKIKLKRQSTYRKWSLCFIDKLKTYGTMRSLLGFRLWNLFHMRDIFL